MGDKAASETAPKLTAKQLKIRKLENRLRGMENSRRAVRSDMVNKLKATARWQRADASQRTQQEAAERDAVDKRYSEEMKPIQDELDTLRFVLVQYSVVYQYQLTSSTDHRRLEATQHHLRKRTLKKMTKCPHLPLPTSLSVFRLRRQ